MPDNQTLAELRAELHKKWTTYDDVQKLRSGKPLPKGPTRLETKTADDKAEKVNERTWRKGCIKRDGKICRCCKRVVVPQLELAENRLEVHHVAGRADQAVRWDIRNGITLCSSCHEKVTHYRLFILQAARHAFVVGVKTYIDACKKVTFSEKAAA